ncbi:glycosyltransferase family 4 protein [Nitrospirales bacterium NOB]|nr:glycosyltransferase family 4 protein [Nitrospirales bacterium NOB]
MNILFVTPFFPPQTGGVATFVEDIRRCLSNRGHRVVVLRSGESDTITPCASSQHGTVYEFYMRPSWFPDNPMKGCVATLCFFIPTLWKLAEFIAKHEINLVSIEYPLPNVFYFHVLRLFMPFKLVIGIHGDDILSLHLLHRIGQETVRSSIKGSNWLLAHSASLLSQAESLVEGLKVRRTYLPYGVDIERLRVLAYDQNRHQIRLKEPYVLTVAKLHERKGLDILLLALQKVKQKSNGIQFVIAGDGPEEVRLRRMAAELKVNDMVVFLGEIHSDDIPFLMLESQFFLLPSRSEPFGIVLLEAMTFGKAIVASDVGGIPEFVKTDYNGILVPPCDVDALAAAIEQMLGSRELRTRLGANGLALVERQYDYPRLVEQYERLFEGILNCA